MINEDALLFYPAKWKEGEEIEDNEIVNDTTTGKLQNNLTIKKALVDTKGKTYDEVEKIEE